MRALQDGAKGYRHEFRKDGENRASPLFAGWRKVSVFPAHATADAANARELSAFLESGCEVVCFTADAAIKPGEDLLSAAELGRCADVLVLLLSSASNLGSWRRERWEPVLLANPLETGTHVAIVLLEECPFPAVLRRGSKFFDATAGLLPALRRLKRWLWGIQMGTAPAMHFSPDLEDLYCQVADQAGTATSRGAIADRFAREAALDFESVLWIPSHGRTLAQIAGEIGAQLEMRLDGLVEENCQRIRGVLSGRRCLLVLDAPEVVVEALLPGGRTSVLFTSEPVRVVEQVQSLAVARGLVQDGRFAEVYDLLYQLLRAGVDAESCARDLIWICEHWDRVEEANSLRFHLGPSPGEQLRLF